MVVQQHINPLHAELNPICHLLALLGAHHILHVSGTSVKHNSNHFRLSAAVCAHFLSALHHRNLSSDLSPKCFLTNILYALLLAPM